MIQIEKIAYSVLEQQNPFEPTVGPLGQVVSSWVRAASAERALVTLKDVEFEQSL